MISSRRAVEAEALGIGFIENLNAEPPIRGKRRLDRFPRSRRWKSGSAPEILTASSHASEWVPARGSSGIHELRRALRVAKRKLCTPKPASSVSWRNCPVRHDPHQHVGRLGHERHESPERVVRRGRCGMAWCGSGLTACTSPGISSRPNEDTECVSRRDPSCLRPYRTDGSRARRAQCRSIRAHLRPSRSETNVGVRLPDSAKIGRGVRSVRGSYTRNNHGLPIRAHGRCAQECARDRSA